MKSLRSHQPLDTLPEEKKRGAKHSKTRRKKRKNHSKGLKPKDLRAGGGVIYYVILYVTELTLTSLLSPSPSSGLLASREKKDLI